MSEKKSSNSSNHGIKSKLDLIWNELQTNLPSINFNESNEDDTTDELDFDQDIAGFKVTEDDYDFVNISKSDDDYLNYDLIDRIEKASISDVYLNETDELNQRLESFNQIKTSNSKLISNSNDSAQSAAKITKNIFDTTSSKLNMDIFNSINIDELLNSVNKKKGKPNTRMDASTQATSRLVDDESIMKKLAEMSHEISKDNSLNSLNYKTGAVSSDPSNRASLNSFNSNSQKNQINFNDNRFKNSLNMLDEEITNDLKKFLKSHKIKDGNLVETRKLDLRSSQNMEPSQRVRVYSKPKAENLFQEILNENSIFPDKNDKNLKFINDNENESSSDESDNEDNNNDLWIERYRRQKLLNMNKK